MEGVILDADHVVEDGKTYVRLYLKSTERSIAKIPFNYYFYVIGGKPEGYRTEEVEKKVGNELKKVYKVFVDRPGTAQKLKEELENKGYECREYDFGVEKRFFLDTGVAPMEYVVVEDGYIEKKEKSVDLLCAAIDIEVLARDRMPDYTKDPVIMISYVDTGGYKCVLTTKEVDREFVTVLESEEKMFSELNGLIKERDPDVIFGYNSDAFDLPYLKKRGGVLGLKLPWGLDGSEIAIRRGGGRSITADIKGRMHVDVYKIVEAMAGMGAINTFRLDLESVYVAVTGKEKIKIEKRNIADEWINGDLEKLAEYNLQDSEACLEIGMKFFPLYVELSKLTLSNLYEATRMSTSQIVEWRLIAESVWEGKIVPKRPKEEIVRKRLAETYKGGYVREPLPGLHENIIVFDFRSLYPSIIISHNVDPDLVNKPLCPNEERYVSPAGHFFCKSPRGTLPRALEKVLNERLHYKKLLKELDKDSEEYRTVYARQQALKIIANSAYGYLGYARARWYSKECAEAVTAWAREYIIKTMKEAEQMGLKVLYGDTDSVFCIADGDPKEAAKKFLDEINKKLPPPMGLELEGIYVRGIFITKRGEKRAAKKKYALVDQKGNLKIVGLEYVRRDWAEIAREVQKKVLEYALVEGKPEKALKYVKEITRLIREKKLPKEKFIIYTQIQKDIEAYEQKGPHVVVAKKAIMRGIPIKPGSIIAYIVREGSVKISERAELAELVGEKEYDAEYYINNHVLPAVLPILEELGYSKQDILKPEEQKTLFDFT